MTSYAANAWPGYLVYAPDLLGEGPWLRCIVSTFRAFRARVGKPFELIESCRRRLGADPDCTGRVGVIGFCMGGGFALLLSAEGYHAASVNYGMVPSDIDELAARAGPIVASYGGRDWTVKGVPALREALRAHDVPHDVEVYPTAGHCFLTTSRMARCCSDRWRGYLMRDLSRRRQPMPGGGSRTSSANIWDRVPLGNVRKLGFQ